MFIFQLTCILTYAYCIEDRVTSKRGFCKIDISDSSSDLSSSSSSSDSEWCFNPCRDKRKKCIIPCKPRKKCEIICKKPKRCSSSSSSSSSSSTDSSVDCNEIFTFVSFVNRDTVSRVNSEISLEFSNLLKGIHDIVAKDGVDLKSAIVGCLNNLEKSILIIAQRMFAFINENIESTLKTGSVLLNKAQGEFLSSVEKNIFVYIQQLLAITDPVLLFATIQDINGGLLPRMTEYLNQINNGLVPIVNTGLDDAASAIIAANDEERKEMINKIETAFDFGLVCILEALSSITKNMDDSFNSLIALQLLEARRSITKIMLRGNKEIISGLSVLLRNICGRTCLINPNNMLLI